MIPTLIPPFMVRAQVCCSTSGAFVFLWKRRNPDSTCVFSFCLNQLRGSSMNNNRFSPTLIKKRFTKVNNVAQTLQCSVLSVLWVYTNSPHKRKFVLEISQRIFLVNIPRKWIQIQKKKIPFQNNLRVISILNFIFFHYLKCGTACKEVSVMNSLSVIHEFYVTARLSRFIPR